MRRESTHRYRMWVPLLGWAMAFALGMCLTYDQAWGQTPTDFAPGSAALGAPDNNDPEGDCPAIMPQSMRQTVSGSITLADPSRVWCFEAAARQAFEFSTCAPEGSATFAPIISILSADGLTLLATAFGSPDCQPGRTRLAWAAPAAGSYRVRVQGNGPVTGSFTMAYRLLEVPACEADLAPAPDFQTVSGSILTGEFRDYCFDAAAGRIYDFTTCAPGSATFDTVLEIRDLLGRTVLAINDDFCNEQSYISWPASGTGPFRVRVYGFNKAGGDFDLAYRVAPLAPCKTVEPQDDYQTVDGAIDSEDFQEFCFDATPGQAYEFQTCSPGAADFATALEIRNEVGDTVLLRGDTVCGLQSRVTWTAAVPQRVRVRVSGTGVREFGSFRLAHRRLPCQPIVPDLDYQFAADSVERGQYADYCLSATAGQTYEFSTCTPGSADFATTLQLRTVPGDANVFIPLTSCGGQTRALWTPTASGAYRLRLRGSQLSESGSFSLAYRVVPAPACAGLEPDEQLQTTGGTLPGGATKDYCFDAQAGETFEFTTCPPQGRADANLSLEVRNGGDSAILAVLSRTTCATGQRVVFRAPSAGRFRIKVRN